MEYISLIVSLIGTGFTIYMYFTHNKKLNEQQNQLNEQQKQLNEQQKELNIFALRKAKQLEEDDKRAMISLQPEMSGKPHKLIISNTGKAKARYISISAKDKDKDPLSRCNHNPFWEELNPGQSISQIILFTNICEKAVNYDIKWTDELGEHSESQTVYY